MRFEYVNNLRGLAILFIILAHTIILIPTSPELEILRFLLLNSSILFVVIAGFLFAAIAERYTYKAYLVNKFKNVILPYLFLSFPAALIYILGYKSTHLWLNMDNFSQLSAIAKYVYLLVTGAHLGPLWFIPMIIVFYLFFPFFIFILHITKRNLAVIFIVSLCVGLYLGRPTNNDDVILSFLYFIPAYLWGVILYRSPSIVKSLEKYCLLLLVLYLVLVSIYYGLNGYSSSPDLLIKILFSTLLYSFFSQYFDRKISLFHILAQLSFFLFFVHGYFAGGLRIYFASTPVMINKYLLFIGVFGIVLVTSLLSFYILQPFVGKYKRQLLAVS